MLGIVGDVKVIVRFVFIVKCFFCVYCYFWIVSLGYIDDNYICFWINDRLFVEKC